MLMTFVLVTIGWIIFRAESVGQAMEYLCGMWHFGTLKAPFIIFFTSRTRMQAGLFLFVALVEWVNRSKSHPLQNLKLNPMIRWTLYFVLATAVWWFYTDVSGFIYQQF